MSKEVRGSQEDMRTGTDDDIHPQAVSRCVDIDPNPNLSNLRGFVATPQYLRDATNKVTQEDINGEELLDCGNAPGPCIRYTTQRMVG